MTNQIVKALEHGAEKLGKTLAEDAGKAVKDLYHSAGENLKKVAKNTREVDTKHAEELKKLHGSAGKGQPHAPRTPGGGSSSSHGAGHGSGQPHLRDGAASPRDTAKPPASRQMRSDPVDIASGEMVMVEQDVALDAALPLLLARTHLSSYRVGRWFGRSWASTLDQRIEVDAEGAFFAGDDGTILHYPLPGPDAPVLPLEGPRRPLRRESAESEALLVTDPDSGVVRRFEPLDEVGASDGTGVRTLPLVALTDRNGNSIEILRSPSGAPREIRHSGGYRIAVDTAGSRVTALRLLGATPGYQSTLQSAVQDAVQSPVQVDAGEPDVQESLVLVRFGYDAYGDLAEVVNSSGLAMRYTYDEWGRITTWTDRNHRRYRYLYDRAGRCVQTRGEGGFLDATFSYDTEQRITTVTDSLGHHSRYQLNELGQTVAETDPLGHTVLRTWDRYDRLLSRTDALGRTVSFAYDTDGNLTAVTRPDGATTTLAYDEQNRVVQKVGPEGATCSFGYDERGNPASVTDSAGTRTGYEYDERGLLTAVTDPDGGTRRIEYDAAGLAVRVVDPDGGTEETVRDAFGRPVAVTDATGTSRATWTVEGRAASRTGPDGAAERWEWDGEGNLLAHTDRLGQRTTFSYTHFDLPAGRIEPSGARYAFDYDTELRLTRVTNPVGLTWNYTYDAVGNPSSETDFDGRTLRYEHDAAGQLTARTTALGHRTGFTRDVLGRVVAKDVDGVVTRYVFDQAGRLRSAHSPTSSLTRDFNPDGTAVETVDGRSLLTRFDDRGRRTARRTPAGVESGWAYTSAGLPAALSFADATLAFTQDEAGRDTEQNWNFGLAVRQEWRPDDRLSVKSVEVPEAEGSRTIQRRAYDYRLDGGLVSIDEELGGPRRFTLDAAGRVTAVQARSWSESYAYDECGNLAEAHWPVAPGAVGCTGTRSYRGTELAQAGSVQYTYDQGGRLTERRVPDGTGGFQVWQYSWNAEDQLVAVRTPGGDHWQYTYDPLGRRTAKLQLAEDGTTVLERTLFTWDSGTLCEQTTYAPHLPGPYTLSWEHDGHHPLAQAEFIGTGTAEEKAATDRRFFAIVTDLVGTPTELVDETGEIAWRARTTLWGATTWPSHSTTYTPLRFPGQYFDPETRLHYNVRRYYDPETARYTSPDPLGLAPSPNPANYVVNPHTWLDPLGLTPKQCEVVRVYRKEKWDYRGTPDNSYRVEVDEHGNTSILRASNKKHPDGKSLYVNMSGDRRHTDEYQADVPKGGRIQSFEVPKSYLEHVRNNSVHQRLETQIKHEGFMSVPPEGHQDWAAYKSKFYEISDPTQGPDLYGIPPHKLGDLDRHIIPGSGRTEEYAPKGWEATHDGKPLNWEEQNKQWSGEAAEQRAKETALAEDRARREANKQAALARKAAAAGKHH
ncbi:RHS repeat-associated core domain-containing protein [Kitasatospora sp. HPMI-4]|uniref:RHS repeat-associated core domain-containing protein n=1 Tax=Kitasatospora sp. HPMI-4 TaxID=3448443 RepID=UPI003F1DBFB3